LLSSLSLLLGGIRALLHLILIDHRALLLERRLVFLFIAFTLLPPSLLVLALFLSMDRNVHWRWQFAFDGANDKALSYVVFAFLDKLPAD